MASTNYPGSLDAYPVPNNGDTISVADHWLGPAVIGIETELGTDPAGSFTDVKSRLDSGLIEELDLWFVPSAVTGLSGESTITSWQRSATTPFIQNKGTGLSQSAGVFSFNSTGYYEIFVSLYIYGGSTAATVAGFIYTTEDGSNYNNKYLLGVVSDLAGYSPGALFPIKVTDTSNQKFYVNSFSGATTYNLSGSLIRNDSYLYAKKIGGL